MGMRTVLYPWMGRSIPIHRDWGSQSGISKLESGNVDTLNLSVGRTIPIYMTLCLQKWESHTVLYPWMGRSIPIHRDWGSQSGISKLESGNVDMSDPWLGRAIPIYRTSCSQNGSVHCGIPMNGKIYFHSWRLGFPKWNLKVDMSNLWAGRATPTYI